MSGAPRARSMNVADSETRPVLGPTGNKASSLSACKPSLKPLRKKDKSPDEYRTAEGKKASQFATVTSSSPQLHPANGSSVLRRHEQLLHSNSSLNLSCSSDASTESFLSRASTGRLIRSSSVGYQRKPVSSKPRSVFSDGSLDSLPSVGPQVKKTCAWVTPNTEPCYAAFHDEEWGVPVHDDRKLFELLVLSSTLSELTWPAILSKRHFQVNEKKTVTPGSAASSLLSELKLRAIFENARQITKVN
ncbi:uncharacterized protein LOC115752628 [Rhodamnia argentea]|uniref:Uncharacterized protein LOC115752628 n=1 Tax=Rhodamnia argentea TaxID=178133 RepID=A0ABM3HBQ3_9MYRT|nr:uncharacterized protein LOC115752628 [Rhodamnia argentea]